jgi:GNAT superfamily N-acetyltransferase
MTAVVRRINQQEWPVLRDLRLQSLLDAPEAFGQTHENALAIPDEDWQQVVRASSSGNTRTWLIASLDGADVGLVQARRRAPDDCLIFSMWVAPQARRSGVGQKLIDAVADWAPGWEARRLVLWVFGANDGAHRFYERIGFTVLPDGPDAESGKSFGAFAMERPVPNAS